MHHFVEEEAENCSLSNLMIPDPSTKDQKLGQFKPGFWEYKKIADHLIWPPTRTLFHLKKVEIERIFFTNIVRAK